MIQRFASIALSAALLCAALTGVAAAAPHANPNGNPPIGKPAIQRDVDRGHNDRAHVRVVGRVRAISGHTVTLVTTGGTAQTFTLTPTEIVGLRTGERVVFFTNAGLVSLVEPADETVELVGPVTAISGNLVTVMINGVPETFLLTPSQMIGLQSGERIVLFTNAGAVTMVEPAATTVHFIGPITALNSDFVTVMVNGTPMMFAATPALVSGLQVGQRIVVFTRAGTVTQVQPAVVSLRGVITTVVPTVSNKSMVTVRLPNGRLKTITVANEAAENMQLRQGEPVIIKTTTGFMTTPTIQIIHQQ